MKGQRIVYTGAGLPPEGAYWQHPLDNNWYGMTPGKHLAGFALHQVTEHDDGTISVWPSILVRRNNVELWHGFLEHGVWRKC